MNTNSIDFNIKYSAQKKSCSNTPALGCKSCQRLPGIPIFPVRYSTCSIRGNESIPKLPDNIINSFTSITLDQFIDDNGILKKGTPLNRYILRKLRKGYLYLYDEIYGGQWQCFGIYPSGELIAFAPAKPTPLTSLNKFSCSTPTNTYLSSIITIPNGENRNVYISYVEYPWSIEHMDRLKNDVAMRQNCMQELKITSNSEDIISSNKGLLRPYNEIVEYLPEYNSKYSKYSIGKIDLKSSIIQGGLLKSESKDEEQTAIKNALSSAASDKQSHPGLMLIIHDEIGLIEQLKISRQEPHDEVKRKAIERPNGLGLREISWLQAVQKLEEGIANQFNEEIEKIYNKDTANAHENFIKEGTKLYADMVNNYNNPSPFDAESYTPLSAVVKRHNQDIIDMSLMQQKVLSEFKRYYDNDKKKSLEDIFNPCFENIEKSKFILDANYCDWIKCNLEHALTRYDTTNLEHSSYAVHILGSLLDEGSIFSINSQILWQWLHEESITNSSSILARGICLNNDKVRLNYDIAQLENDPHTLKSNEAPSIFTDTLKLKNWYDIIKKGQKLYEKRGDIKTKELTTPSKFWRAGWKDFWKPYKQLQQALSTSRIALYQQHLAQLKAEQPVNWKKAIEPSPTLKQLQIAGAIEASIAREPLQNHTFGLSEIKVDYKTSLNSIEINNNNYKRNVPTSHDYMPNAFKTGNQNISHKASGNFVYSNQEIYNIKNSIKRTNTKNNSNYYFSPEATQKNKIIYSNTDDYSRKHPVEIEASHKINYYAITNLPDNIPETQLSNEEKVLLAEQTKVAEAWTNGKSAIIYANFIMSFINMRAALDSLGKKDAGLEQWWKVIGTSIATLQAAGDIISNTKSYRSANALGTINKFELATEASVSKFGTNFLGKTVAIIGIIDSIIAFSKAYKKYKHGGTARDMYVEMTISALSLAGSIATIVAGSAVLAPVMLTLIIIIVGLSFLLTHLVPKNIENWLRRSLYGKNQETVQGKVFQDMLVEQSSLQMVLKGIAVDVELNHAILKSEVEPDFHTYVIKAEIQYPKTLDEDIEIIIKNKLNDKKIATIKKLANGKIQNKFWNEVALSRLSEKELSIIDNNASAQDFNTLKITYILGVDSKEEEKLDVSFEVNLNNILKRDIFYVSA